MKKTAATAATDAPPAAFLCPLSGALLEDPVVDACGHAFDRAAILAWLEDSSSSRDGANAGGGDGDDSGGVVGRCPLSGRPTRPGELRRHDALAERVEVWRWGRRHAALRRKAAILMAAEEADDALENDDSNDSAMDFYYAARIDLTTGSGDGDCAYDDSDALDLELAGRGRYPRKHHKTHRWRNCGALPPVFRLLPQEERALTLAKSHEEELEREQHERERRRCMLWSGLALMGALAISYWLFRRFILDSEQKAAESVPIDDSIY